MAPRAAHAGTQTSPLLTMSQSLSTAQLTPVTAHVGDPVTPFLQRTLKPAYPPTAVMKRGLPSAACLARFVENLSPAFGSGDGGTTAAGTPRTHCSRKRSSSPDHGLREFGTKLALKLPVICRVELTEAVAL